MLRCSQNAFEGSYDAFERWRVWIVESLGGTWKWNTKNTPTMIYMPDQYDLETYSGLYVLFTHSCVEGEISVKECKKLYKNLKDIFPILKKHDIKDFGHIEEIGGMVEVTKNFMDGCRRCYKNEQSMIFK